MRPTSGHVKFDADLVNTAHPQAQNFFFFEWPTYEYATIDSSVNAADEDTAAQFEDTSEWLGALNMNGSRS